MKIWIGALAVVYSVALIGAAPQSLLRNAMDSAANNDFTNACKQFYQVYRTTPSYESFTPADRTAMDAVRKNLAPGELIDGLENPDTAASLTPENSCAYAFTAYLLYEHDHDRAGSERAIKMALREYARAVPHAPTRLDPPQGVPEKAGSSSAEPPPGVYGCMLRDKWTDHTTPNNSRNLALGISDGYIYIFPDHRIAPSKDPATAGRFHMEGVNIVPDSGPYRTMHAVLRLDAAPPALIDLGYTDNPSFAARCFIYGPRGMRQQLDGS